MRDGSKVSSMRVLSRMSSIDIERQHRRLARILGVRAVDLPDVLKMLRKTDEEFKVDIRILVQEALALEREARIREAQERADKRANERDDTSCEPQP